MSEVATIYVTRGLRGTRIVEVNKDYVVVDKATLTVLDSSNRSLVGKTYSPPKPIVGRTTGTASIPPPPLPFQVALWIGKALFTHETIIGEFPPGFEGVFEIMPEFRGIYQYIWAMTFGDLVDSRVVLIHEVPGMMKEHEDPFILSIVDTVYPLNIRVSHGSSHRCRLIQGADVPVTIEATFWMVETDSEGAKLIDSMFEGLGKILQLQIPMEVKVELEPITSLLKSIEKKLDELICLLR